MYVQLVLKKLKTQKMFILFLGPKKAPMNLKATTRLMIIIGLYFDNITSDSVAGKQCIGKVWSCYEKYIIRRLLNMRWM